MLQTDERIEQLKKNLVSTVPLGHMGTPDKVAKAVSFLASDEASYISGATIAVTGGKPVM